MPEFIAIITGALVFAFAAGLAWGRSMGLTAEIERMQRDVRAIRAAVEADRGQT